MSPRVHRAPVTISAAPGKLVAFAAIAALVALDSMPAGAGPNGATVVGGAASVQGAGTGSVTVNQTSQNAVINWSTFNIGAGETTTFTQPNSSAIALNRVIGGGGASFIDGTLTANGRVFIVNGDGVLIGRGAVIRAAGFLATTNDINNQDFMNGSYNFSIPGNPNASIVNLGHITATNGGFAALVAPGVRNSGTISARLGTVALAAGNSFTLDFYGDQLITLAVNDQIASSVIDVATGKPLKSLVGNTGTLKANGGVVQLTAAAAERVVHSVINNKGVIEANSIGKHNGMIVLSAATGASKGAGAPVQTVKLSGKISAAGKKAGTTGGTVVVTGENIVLAGAKIDASGQAGGGHVLIGGDTGGGNPSALAASIAGAGLETFAVPTATTVSVDAASVIDASATGSGNGGKVILWSDQQTTFAGTILARGGSAGGNGGFVETSSHGVLNFAGTANTLAPQGAAGTLLLDPYDVVINNTYNLNGSFVAGTWVPNASVSYLTSTALESQLANGNVVVTTLGSSPGSDAGNITIDDNVTWNNNNSLTLSAYNSINFQSGFTITNTAGGNLILRADNSATGTGTVTFATTNQIDYSGSTGTVSIYYNPSSYSSPTDFTSNVLTNGSVPNQLIAYMLVNNATNLANIGANNITLAGTYALGTNIDATGFAGFSSGTTFNGVLNGNGGLVGSYFISNLTLSSSQTMNAMGLFPFIGTSGVVENLGLSNVNITAGADIQNIGAIAGANLGTISNVTVASGNVSGGAFMGIGAGGVVGQNQGTITNAISAVTVSVGNATSDGELNFAGGIVASNLGTISNAIATGNVAGGAFSWVGGLVGQNGLSGFIGAINSSYALGNVNVSGFSSMAGGLVGFQQQGSGIFNSQAFGDVTATANAQQSSDGSFAGGLVGQNFGAINGASTPTLASRCIPGATMSCAAGAVSVGTYGSAGGLVGGSQGFIGNALANGAVSGSSNDLLGGLVGESDNGGSVVASMATGNVHGSGANDVAGGLVGLNLGSIDPSMSSGSVSAGPNSIVGGLVGANEAFTNFPPIGQAQFGSICAECVATGTATGGPGSIVGPQVGFGAGSSGSDANLPSQALLIQDMLRDFTLASLTPGDVVDTTALNGPAGQPPRPGRGPGGLPPQFGSRFFVVPPPGETRFVKDEVVLQIPTNIPFVELQAIMRQLGLSVLGSTSLDLLGVTTYRLHIDNGATLASVIRALASHQIIAGAQANYIYGLAQDLAQNDPQQLAQDLAQDPDLAGRTQEGDAAQYALGKLGMIDLHRVVKGANITIAVIDSQVDVNHPDLDGVIVEQFDAVGQAEAPHPHGTGMAGAIAAHRRLMGIAPSAKIYAIHAFSSSAASAESTTFNILKGLDWAANKGVRVINMSFAGPRDPSMERALHAAHDKGIVLVAAAGNAGPKSPPLYPGADPDVIAVTATDINDKVFSGANRGRYIALAAPGVDILVPAPDSTYQLTTGTSVASAEVSGIAALLLERNPNLTPDEIRKILTASARHPGSKERDDDFGWGLVDPSKAIQDVNDLKPVARQPADRR